MKNTNNWFERRATSDDVAAKECQSEKSIFVNAKRNKIIRMLRNTCIITSAIFIQILFVFNSCTAQSKEEKISYPEMAPLNQYLIQDRDSEIALARSAAPSSISANAEVLILERTGYTVAVKGTNGFVCIVERSWAKPDDDPEFWDPKILAPVCYNPQSATTYIPFDLMKTKLVLAGKSKTEITKAIASAFENKNLPALKSGAMCYMMSKQQYLTDQGKNWHPHLMFYLPGRAEKNWGANLPDSPVIAVYDAQVKVTVFMVWVGKWSDDTPAPVVH